MFWLFVFNITNERPAPGQLVWPGVALKHLLYGKSVLQSDSGGGGKVDQFIGMFEDPQFQDLSDNLKRLQTEQSGQLFNLDVICQKDSPAWLAGVQQVSGGKFGRPGWRLWRSARESRLSSRGFFRRRCEFISAHVDLPMNYVPLGRITVRPSGCVNFHAELFLPAFIGRK